MDLKNITDRFDENLERYKPIPFWSWNAKLEPEQLKKQIDEMKRNEIGGYFMHARGGLKTEYMSEEWMQCIEACAEHGLETGMASWIYDENGWPSGFAGGKLLEREENRDCYVVHKIGAYDAEATVCYLMDGERLWRATRGKAGKDYLNVYIRRAASTADILNPEVVDQFLDMTHERYKERFGEQFSEKIRGFFTDEPQYYRAHTPYTDMLEVYFKEHYGEDILDELGLLFVEKAGYRKFRYRYWKAMQELMLRNYAQKVYEWCESNGVELTGHYVEEVTLGNQMMCCAGVMPFYEYEHIPGIDWLGPWTNNELSPRQVVSVARQLGKKQVLTESFACCGWQITPAELKRIAEFQFVNGANLLCHHLLPYAEYGQRKRDYPAHFSDFNPWINHEFAEFNRYFTRLGYLLAESEEKVNVAILHPIRSTYFEYKREEEGFHIGSYDELFLRTLRQFSEVGINYHFLDETLLAKYGFVRGQKIGCGKCSYSYLVLPYIATMDVTTERLLHEFVKNGGQVLVLGEKPGYLETERYSYDYLESNCTFEQIVGAQEYRVTNRKTELYSSYRKLGKTEFLYVVNASPTESYTQRYRISQAASFERLDLCTLEHKTVPLTVTFAPGESALLFPNYEVAEAESKRKERDFKLQNAQVSFQENAYLMDKVCYSVDGITFSKPYLYTALFQKLLKDRYEGDIWFRYEFDIETLPEEIRLNVEECQNVTHYLNGEEIVFETEADATTELLSVDIASYVKQGKNCYVAKRQWYQSELVYYSLFGEDVTENLKNCIVYDCELEPAYISGRFGVYSGEPFEDDKDDSRYTFAKNFHIGKTPERVTEPVYDGFPFFAGTLSIRQNISLKDKNIVLKLPGTWLVAYVRVNGKEAGKCLFTNRLDISECAVQGENEIEIDLIIGNRNRCGPQHFKGKLARAIVTPGTFELNEHGNWEDDKNPVYEERYELLKLHMV